jgi:serine/threonine protein kinase
MTGMWNSSIRYEMQELLGEGSQGRVYKALRRDRASGLVQTVAAKILHSKIAVDLWKREFESLARVRSSYCVQVHAFERLQNRPALILEFVDGVSLYKLCQSCLLAEDEIQEVMAQAEAGVLDLYKYGIFHGDLSPHNILVDQEGRLRLLDFGLANWAKDSSRLTPEFASPERLCGESANLASDIFSLGRLEQFLRGLQQIPDAHSPYLHPRPELRSMRGLSVCSKTQEKLAQRVLMIQQHQRRMRAIRTRTQVISPTLMDPRWRWLAAAAVALTLLVTPGAAQSAKLPPLALLQVHTNNWVQLTLDGQPLGYSPLKLPLTANTTHKLEWVSANGRGEKQIKASAGQRLELKDRDFSH